MFVPFGEPFAIGKTKRSRLRVGVLIGGRALCRDGLVVCDEHCPAGLTAPGERLDRWQASNLTAGGHRLLFMTQERVGRGRFVGSGDQILQLRNRATTHRGQGESANHGQKQST